MCVSVCVHVEQMHIYIFIYMMPKHTKVSLAPARAHPDPTLPVGYANHSAHLRPCEWYEKGLGWCSLVVQQVQCKLRRAEEQHQQLAHKGAHGWIEASVQANRCSPNGFLSLWSTWVPSAWACPLPHHPPATLPQLRNQDSPCVPDMHWNEWNMHKTAIYVYIYMCLSVYAQTVAYTCI